MSTAPNPVTFEAIAPLVVDCKDEASGLFVTFRCPVTGTEVRSDGRWPDDNLVERTAGQVKRGLLSSVRNTLAKSVRDAIGSHTSSPVASIGADASQQIIYGAANEHLGRQKRSDEDRRHATVNAFNTVAGKFTWDEHAERFVASDSPTVQPSEFDRFVAANPIRNEFDRDVAMRLIASLVASDGAITDDERADFSELFPGASLDQVVSGRAPNHVDFEETMTGASRATTMLLAWAVALTDDRLSGDEQSILDAAAEGLGIEHSRAAELSMLARSHVIDQAIAELIASGLDRESVRGRVEDLGDQIGLGRDEAARAFIRWSKRSS